MKFPALPLRSLARRTVALLFSFLILSIFFLGLTKTSFAQTTNQTPQPQQNQPYMPMSAATNPDVPKNLNTWTQTVLIEVISASSCAITGIDPTNPNQPCLGLDQKTGKIGYIQNGGGAIGMLTSSMAMLYNPPVHTGDYINYLSSNFGITKPSYAAVTTGTGFNQLAPIMHIWIAFRNISYMLFIIIFLVIGMAIMLRVRIDPRTVMTIQNQIPKIIIGVVMVTFSFAIAGFLIDMMWTSMYVSYGILSTVPGPNGAKYVDISGLTPQDMQATTPIGLVNSNNYHVLTVGGTQSSGVAGIANQLAVTLKDTVRTSLGVRGCDQGVGGVVGSVTSCLANFSPFDIIVDANEGNVITILLDAVSFVVATGTYIKVATMIAGESESVPLIGTLFSVSAGNGISLLAATGMYTLTEFILREILPWLIIFLVVYIAMFFALMRLWFELLKSFVFILFDVIFAPFWIMASLIPGNTSMGIGSWIKDLAANLAAFPAVAAMFILGKILMDAFSQPGSGPVFVPPLIGNSQDTHFLGAIIGLAVILSTPQVVTMIKKAIKAPEVKLGGVGAAIGFGAGAPKRMASGSLSSVFSPHIDKKTGSLTYPGGFFGQILRGFGATRG